VANVFCGVEPKTGEVMVRPTPNRKANAFALFFRSIIKKYKDAKKVHLVLDNLNTHKEKSLTDAFGMRIGKYLWNRAAVHYTPKHASFSFSVQFSVSVLPIEKIVHTWH
jgi:hypothetical protein